MIIGPLVLIVLRVYLQIYVEHSGRLDRLAQSVPVVRPPTLVPLENSLIRLFSGLVFYALLPAAMLCFAWKAAVLPNSALFIVATSLAIAVIAYHEMLLSWRSKGLLSASVAIIAAGIIHGYVPPRRFNLNQANLSRHSLARMDLNNANLRFANLSGATLGFSDLSGANLSGANLSGATLTFAKLNGAALGGATLSGAVLFRAELIGATLNGADLSGANLSGAKLNGAWLGMSIIPGNSSVVDPRSGVLENLGGANLSKANLSFADLSGADLFKVDLSGANLSDALISDVKNLTQTQLDKACGNANTKLPEDFTLKPCG
jgi:uncharacterized protein YjbI with pentapeptide repeats